VALSGEHSQNERNAALQALRDGRARVCVATDVAARGIDLPTLSLVIHVELPRDAETLQHRSGRTGRAGNKGTAVLIVPYPRRRRVEMMLRGARIPAEWIGVPTPDDIRARDRERLLARLMAPVEVDEEDQAIAAQLVAEKSPEEIAAALVRAYRAALPDPEELIEATPEARRERGNEGHRPGFDEAVWFRMNIGKRHNADPRWILPLLCRKGHVTRAEVGAIRIAPGETWFQVPQSVAAKFASAIARAAGPNGEDEDGIRIERAPVGMEGPQQSTSRRGPPRGRPAPRRR
jgi:ATP-dependent RNA helicase DeaD